MSQNNKELTLRAFSIKINSDISKQDIDLFKTISDKIKDTIVKERVMLLNQEDETAQSDLLSNYTLNDNNIFATMMRIAPGADDSHIGNELMEKNTFSITDIQRNKNNAAAIYKNHFYICFNKNFLVTTLPKTTTIKRVETYLNWLAKSHIYELTPVIEISSGVKLSDLSSVVFKTPCNIDTSSENLQNDTSRLSRITILKESVKKIFETIFADSTSLNDIDIDQIISAELKLTLKKPKKMSEQDYKNTYGALLKPVSDIDNVTLKDRHGRDVTGEDLLKTTRINIQTTDTGFIQEPQLYIEMAKFIDGLEK